MIVDGSQKKSVTSKQELLIKQACPVCQSQQYTLIFKSQNIPQYNLHYFNTKAEAEDCLSVNVEFVKCEQCTFVFNRVYKQLDYLVEYTANRSESLLLKDYLREVVDLVRNTIKTNIKTVVEVGAGDGCFADEFIRTNVVSFHAFEPAKNAEINIQGVRFYNKYYDQNTFLSPDLVILRHVLEHQSDVLTFISGIVFEKPRYVFLEIPCYEFVENNNYHYFSNEHCSYFSRESLDILMRKCGYKSLSMSFAFGKEYILGIFEVDPECGTSAVNSSPREMSRFNQSFAQWKQALLKKFDSNTILWGVSGKGVMLVNMLGLNAKLMPNIIDINPKIQGKFIPITANKICSPISIANSNVKKILVSNRLYLQEIRDLVKTIKQEVIVESLFDM